VRLNTEYQVDPEALRNCAKEAIHQIQRVQTHGFLLACDRYSGVISFASRNATQILALARESLLGEYLGELLQDERANVMDILAKIAPGTPAVVNLRFRLEGGSTARWEVLAHSVDNTVVIEAMPCEESIDAVHDREKMEDLLTEIGSLHREKSLPEFLQACALQVRELTQYQRVIIYRLLPDWSGEVLAESVDAGVETRFLGLRFPASDIPPQARELYRINLLRIIGDTQATPVPLESAVAGALLDQSHSLLRAPSQMHVGYLKNMGVRASMTASLMKDGALWGVVSCHHHEPKTPPVHLRRITRMLCALIAETAVLRIDSLEHQAKVSRSLGMHEILMRLVTALDPNQSFHSQVSEALRDASQLLHVHAVGLMVSGQWLIRDQIPPALVDSLQQAARKLGADASFFTHKLASDLGMRGAGKLPWAGAAIIRLNGHEDSFLVLLREELVQHIHWAGAPSTTAEVLPNGLRVLGPRNSFDTWTQTVHEESESWSEIDKTLVADIARAVGGAYRDYRNVVMQAELHMLGSCMARLNDMVLVTETDCLDEPGPRILYVNDAFVAKTGYTRSEVIGRSPRFLQGEQTDRATLDVLRTAIKAWSPVTVELVNYKKSGEPYWAEISMAPIADDAGWSTHWVAIERDIEERKRAEMDIQKLVYYDSLTNLPNRRLLMDRLRVALSNSKRYGRNGALMFVDLDYFKDLNDTAGHHVGDELLRQVAIRLVSEVRLEDTVARLGGDEFMILLEGLSANIEDAAASAQQVAEKLIASLGRVYELDGRQHSTTASLGISLFRDKDKEQEQTADELVKRADFAMYQSKAAGRNAWRFYDPQTQAALLRRSLLAADLKQAFEARELAVHYQPIMNRDRKLSGVEALLRWHHRERGWVSPAEFIPIAELNGMIVPIGTWVLEQACQLLHAWAADASRCDLTVSVNVSARQISLPSFVQETKALIGQAGFDPKCLKLELTESLLQNNFDATVSKMEELRAIGVRFSIDDFGTGYSSLAYLRRLPISVLKIDRSFVNDIDLDEGDRAICRTILALGRTLNLSVVAEGVETEGQLQFLLEEGCDSFQGFFFSKALPLQDLHEKFLRSIEP